MSERGAREILADLQATLHHFGGPDWRNEEIEIVFHHVRKEIIPVMEQAGMDHNAVQALCSWAAKLVMSE